MAWYLKAALVGAGTAVAARFIDAELEKRGFDGTKRAAILGAAELLAFIALARAVGDSDANLATPT